MYNYFILVHEIREREKREETRKQARRLIEREIMIWEGA